MPAKMNMYISNGNSLPSNVLRQINPVNLPGANPSLASANAPSSLNASIIARIHSVRPGCGSCGRH
jgi:hypothetical protein